MPRQPPSQALLWRPPAALDLDGKEQTLRARILFQTVVGHDFADVPAGRGIELGTVD